MEIRGIKPKKIAEKKHLELFELRPPEYFSVPLVADDGNTSLRAVNVDERRLAYCKAKRQIWCFCL